MGEGGLERHRWDWENSGNGPQQRNLRDNFQEKLL